MGGEGWGSFKSIVSVCLLVYMLFGTDGHGAPYDSFKSIKLQVLFVCYFLSSFSVEYYSRRYQARLNNRYQIITDIRQTTSWLEDIIKYFTVYCVFGPMLLFTGRVYIHPSIHPAMVYSSGS